ncbi:MAG: ribosome maturation factor RimP, partial [Clostridia bacterium]|nr:ribosome maturation factor RimP [Clostridia bacterium]
MKVKSNAELIEFLTPFSTELGLKIYDVEFIHGKHPSLTVFSDKDGGVELDTCEQFHRAIDLPLDEFDP